MADLLTLNDMKAGLSSPDFKVRKKYVMLLSRIDKPDVIELLTPLLNDNIQEIRDQCKKIINYLTEKYGTYKELIPIEEKNIIKTEIEKASFDPSKLIQLILSDDTKIKISSIMSFYGVKDEHVLKTFIKFIQLEENPLVIATYIKAIGSIGKNTEIDLIKKYLKHADNRVKSNAIEALTELGAYEEVVEEILPLIKANDERLKITAEQYISRIDFDVLLSIFKEISSSRNAEIIDCILKIILCYQIDKTIDFFDDIFQYLDNKQKEFLITSIKSIDADIATDFMSNHNYVNIKFEINNETQTVTKALFNITSEINYADDFYNDGLKYIKNKNYEKAILEFDKSLKLNSRHYKSWIAKGEALLNLENYNGAIHCFDRAILLNTKDPKVFQLKSEALKFLFKDAEAKEYTKKATDLQADINSANLALNPENTNIKNTVDATDNVLNKAKKITSSFAANQKVQNIIKKSKELVKESTLAISSKIDQSVDKGKQLYNELQHNDSYDTENSICPKCGKKQNNLASLCSNCNTLTEPIQNSSETLSFANIIKVSKNLTTETKKKFNSIKANEKIKDNINNSKIIIDSITSSDKFVKLKNAIVKFIKNYPKLFIIMSVFFLFLFSNFYFNHSSSYYTSFNFNYNRRQFKELSKAVSYEQLCRYPNKFIDAKLVFSVKVSQIISDNGNETHFIAHSNSRIEYEYSSSNPFIINDFEIIYDSPISVNYTLKNNESKVLIGDNLVIWGTFIELSKFQNSISSNIPIPHIQAYYIEPNLTLLEATQMNNIDKIASLLEFYYSAGAPGLGNSIIYYRHSLMDLPPTTCTSADIAASIYYAVENEKKELAIEYINNFTKYDNVKKAILLNDYSETKEIEIAKLLIDKGIDINHKAKYSALIYAIRKSNNELAKILLERGADINSKSSDNSTALYEACNTNNTEIAKLLIEKGADVNVVNTFHNSTALYEACNADNTEIAKLLIQKGADVNYRTVLLIPCAKNNTELAKLLIEKGADVNIQGYKGYTPLIWACANNNIEIVKLLIEKGADINNIKKITITNKEIKMFIEQHNK